MLGAGENGRSQIRGPTWPRQWLLPIVAAFVWPGSLKAVAGGSGLNAVVVVNQDSSNSLELGNYYCERRQVPPENVIRISWTGGNISWSSADFEDRLLNPLLDAITVRGLTNQIQYVVLSMDIPFQTLNGSTINSTTAALFYGLKPDPIYGSHGLTNSYAESEAAFAEARPATAPGYSFLASMITARTLDEAKRMVDQGVSSDRSFPPSPAILEKTSDTLRNIRYSAFDNAIFNVRVLGSSSLMRTNSDAPPGPPPVMGYQTGLANFSVAPNAFLPGAMADSLTSFGGVIFGPNNQTSILAFIAAGASGSYGTVAEPFTDPQKFPDPELYFVQSRGFNLAESYYQSVNVPYLGLVVGEPLAAPFAVGAFGSWYGLESNVVLSGTCPLGLRFSGGDRPIGQVDLFVDGKYSQTLTNLAPLAGNQLTVSLNGYPCSYTVPANASLADIATGLAAVINTPATTNLTKVLAYCHGDRIELRSISTNLAEEPFYFEHNMTNDPGGLFYRVRYLPDPEEPEIGGIGRSRNGTFELHTATAPGIPSVLEASTDLRTWVLIWTNLTGGFADFIDSAASQYPRRFYRLRAPEKRPTLSLSAVGGGELVLHVESQTALEYLVQSSPDLVTWSDSTTAPVVGSIDLPVQASGSRRFYRTAVLPTASTPPSLALTAPLSTGGLLLQVDHAEKPYTIEISSNLSQWTPVFTNLAVGRLQTEVASEAGNAESLQTYLIASRSTFLDSCAYGSQSFYIDGSAQPGSWVGLAITKTNGVNLWLAATNPPAGGTLATLAQQLVNAVNSSPALQTPDGVVAEDLTVDAFGAPSFHLRARTAGLGPSRIQATLKASPGLWLSPSTGVALNQNLSDLLPRNHLYLAAGLPRIDLTCPLDTASLADGLHQLSAVAYEGTHVRAQTRTTVQVEIQNTHLEATMLLTDLPETASVHGTYHVQITAHTNTVSRVSLRSTGGLIGQATNQSTATFVVDGLLLGAGLHPLYAEIETAAGLTYQTEEHWVRFVNP